MSLKTNQEDHVFLSHQSKQTHASLQKKHTLSLLHPSNPRRTHLHHIPPFLYNTGWLCNQHRFNPSSTIYISIRLVFQNFLLPNSAAKSSVFDHQSELVNGVDRRICDLHLINFELG
ncbi:hypothetical protein QL285_074507 [Trifolium repens]|nr:hypothetical protein QL285_074507 [Trifolium repens]